MKRIVLVAAALLLFVASPAAAQYGGSFTVTVSDTTVLAGQAVVVEGTCDAAGTVDISLEGHGSLGTATVAADGTYSLTVTIPDLPDGQYTLVATCGDQTSRTTITIGAAGAAATPSPSGPLVRTGSDGSGDLLRWGGLLVVAGAGAVLVGRRLRTAG